MRGFVCPECYLETRPSALFAAAGKTWWSVSPAEASVYGNLCPHREVWPDGTIFGCDSMRVAIDPWLLSDRRPPQTCFGGGEVSIADVATECHLVEAQGDVAISTPPSIAESFRDLDTRAQFQCNPGTIGVNLYDLRDVLLVSARLLLFKDGERIAETRYLVDDREYWMKPPLPRELHRIDAGRTVVVGANLAFGNYYHWLMQCLPAIDCSVRTVGAANCVLALPPLTGWQEASLAMLGHAELPRIVLDRVCHYQFERAHWCGYLSGMAENFLSPRCLEVLERLAARVVPIEDAPERLYVARFDSQNRVIRNEDQVRRLLEGFGFVSVVPGSLPLATQIGLFKTARVVVGGHGAGLANLAFCQPGTTVLELVQSTYPALCMNRIAQGKGLRYNAVCFECGAGGEVFRQRWDVDLDQLETKLRDLL